jgi:predicted Zn-dependent protease
MVSLWIDNNIKCDEFELKNRYLIGMLENYVEKFICPIFSNLQLIISQNKIFKIEHSLDNFKYFINLNKNKFTSKKKIYQLEKFIQILN